MFSESMEDHWRYNCEDTVRTMECANAEQEIIAKLGLTGPENLQQSMFYPVLRAMQLGVRIDLRRRAAMASELKRELAKRNDYFVELLSHPLNPASSKQMKALFYDDLQQKVIKKRATGMPTLDDAALTLIGLREPILRPLLKKITEVRSINVFLNTFVDAPLDEDSRMRCAYNICGTETYRLSSRENAFDTGTNLQNIPKGSKGAEVEDLELPNIRLLFIPDEGYTFFDMDLDRADLQVVVWECDDNDLKLGLRLGLDMHLMNACSIFNIKGIDYHELTETHPNYKNHREKIGEAKRQKAKQGVHATNYFCKANTLAVHLGSTVREAQAFIDSWLGAHPGIDQWHKRVERNLAQKRYVVNSYGYRRFYFDRIEGLLPEALAWIPQSTVAITINRIWRALYLQLPEVQVLLQVHDSLAGQFPTNQHEELLGKIKLIANTITVPYKDPLTIPVGIKTSTESWGNCK